MRSAVVGINWGDEGKGRMVDLLSEEADVVVRYQGGNNAGHTVINPRGKFVLNLLPSGVLREGVVNVLGPGMVIDLAHLWGEVEGLREKGIALSPDTLKISEKAVLCMPYHVQQDILEEERLGDAQFGSTRRGIGPVYGDKYMKKALRAGDLRDLDSLPQKLSAIVDWKNLTLAGGYGAPPVDAGEMLVWLLRYGEALLPYITDTTAFLHSAAKADQNILFEAQLGALRDIDYGIYPYTSSSSTLAAYAPLGAGVPALGLSQVVGVMKAYSTCVGEGPFTAELFGPEADRLREAGGEYGAATGRPRRVGGFDIPASRYGVMMQGADCLALTKLDVLSYMKEIPVCVAYEVDGRRTEVFPSGDALARAKPVYEYIKGFAQDISGCRSAADLPAGALAYIRYLEQAVGCPIRYVSVGPGREDYFCLS